MLSPTESRWIFLNIVRLHISLTHALIHPLSLSLSHIPQDTPPVFVLDFHGFFRVITPNDFIPFSYMEAQSSIECAKYGGL